MDHTALAKFLTSLGSLNGYGSTVLQTKKALDQNSTKPLRQDNEDQAIFLDALKGIQAVKQIGFSADGIIGINKQFNTPSEEQPDLPGHLRNAYYNPDDRMAIIVDEKSQLAYYPPEVIGKQDLETIVDAFNESGKTEADAWRVFARLSKLQPFQDGNKRTALIAANAAYNTFETENYLVLPFNDLDRIDFTVGLMRYYLAATPTDEENAFHRMLGTLPTATDRLVELRQPISDTEPSSLNRTDFKIKRQLGELNMGRKEKEQPFNATIHD